MSGTSVNYHANAPLDIKEEHITLIKPSPQACPNIYMSDKTEDRGSIQTNVTSFSFDNGLQIFDVGTIVTLDISTHLQTVNIDYRPGDIVLVKARAGPAIPDVHVKLLKKYIVKKRKGHRIDWPEYIGWDAKLIYKKEVLLLRKKFQIPYEYPNKVETFVYDEDIISIIN